MEPVRETLVIAEHDLGYALRTVKAVVFLVIYALLTLAAGAIVVWLINKAEQGMLQLGSMQGTTPTPEQMAELRQEVFAGFVGWFAGDPEQAEYLSSIPIVVLFFFWASRFGLPWLIALMAFDQVNGEVHNRSIRYVLLRARRGSVVVGKLLSNMVLLLGLTVITNGIILVFAAFMLDDFEVGASVGHLLRFWLLLIPYGFAYLALMSWISSVFRSPFMSLLVGLAVLLGIGLLGWVAGLVGQWWEPANWLRWIFPTAYEPFLTSHLLSTQLLGAAAFLGYGLLFTALSWLTLKRRDV